ncbi:MAG: tetratricopeptide repeat protein [Kofleriaceae bacterium]
MPRTVLLASWFALVACGARAGSPTLRQGSPPNVPADDLADVKASAKRVDPKTTGLEAKDPRVHDLDIIRIRASTKGVGGERELDSVATADLFRQANEAARTGLNKDAIARYRQLVTEFRESQFAPVALFNIAAVYDGQGDMGSTITTLRELITTYPAARESIDGHLYIAALQAEHKLWADTVATLEAALARPSLTFTDRIEAHARRGYALLELKRYDEADLALTASIDAWRRAPRIDDPYYIAMAHYYRGELVHRKFADAPVRLPDDVLVADLEAKRVLAVQAYDRWKESLGFKHAYWATAAGYQMSQIFVELWEITVKAPYPRRIDAATRPKYVVEVHDRVREHLEKALEGHKMNVELAKAYGVETPWSQGSAQQAVAVMEMLAKDAKGSYLTPAN